MDQDSYQKNLHFNRRTHVSEEEFQVITGQFGGEAAGVDRLKLGSFAYFKQRVLKRKNKMNQSLEKGTARLNDTGQIK